MNACVLAAIRCCIRILRRIKTLPPREIGCCARGMSPCYFFTCVCASTKRQEEFRVRVGWKAQQSWPKEKTTQEEACGVGTASGHGTGPPGRLAHCGLAVSVTREFWGLPLYGVLGRSHFGVWNMPTWPRQGWADPPVSGHRGLRGGVFFALHSPRSRARPASRSTWTRRSSFKEMLFQKAWVGIESPCFWQAPVRRMPHTGTPGAVVSCWL